MDPAADGDAIALTFDDGFANAGAAIALLHEHGLPAAVFVVTGHVGRTNAWGGREQRGIPTLPLLDWPGLERLVDAGVAIGAHTHTHAPLAAIPADAAEEEMGRCAMELRARLGIAPAVMAYPYGSVDAQVAELASSRFQAAVTTRFAAIAGGEPRAQLPRLDMYYFRGPGAIQRWGRSGFAWWLDWVRLRRHARQTWAPARSLVEAP